MYVCEKCGEPAGKNGVCFKCIDELSPEVDTINIKDSTIRLLMEVETG